jgi:Initiator Replication protein, WH1/Initiator Rep protein, WH2
MAKPKRETRQEVIKNSAAIHIDNQITLLQRRTWNAFLFRAYNTLETEEEHSISLQDLARLIGYDSHDMEYLKEASRAMMRCIVEWDVLDKDGSPEWGATALLAQVKITRGMCTYAYSPELRRRLHNPAMYARLDLNLQKQFSSKYSLALWELCTDYLGSGREYGETPFISVEAFRKLMGVTESMYPAFMNFNQKVVKPAVDEINTVSDFRVAVDYQRQGRKVLALKFKMRRVALLPEPNNVQRKLFPELEDMPVIVKELRDAGLSTQDALEIWQQGFAYVDESMRPSEAGEDADVAFVQYIREKIHLLKRRQVSGKVENSTGFLLQAIRQNYANPEFVHELQREASAIRQQAKRVQEKQIKVLEQQKADIESARDRELDHMRDRVASEAPDVLEQAAATLLAANNGFRFLYKRDMTALENYQSSTSLRVFFSPYLEKFQPACFEAIQEHYAARLAAVDEQLAAMCHEKSAH